MTPHNRLKDEVAELTSSSDMERFRLEIELDDDGGRRVQAVLIANDMTMKQFTEYAIVKIVEAHVGDDLLLTDQGRFARLEFLV